MKNLNSRPVIAGRNQKCREQSGNVVVNWHLLEECQFNCKYCYAAWNKPQLAEVYKDADLSMQLISQIASLPYSNIRLSFAGGEPLLDKQIGDKIACARKHNLKTSIITNGHLLDEKFLRKYACQLEMIGVSVDSLNATTNQKVGRLTKGDKMCNYNAIVDLLNLAREINSDIRIKINTVVNAHNFDEDMHDFIARVSPDKWKVLRVLPAIERAAKEKISDIQFAEFKDRHADVKCVIFEDNDCMQNSYLMIDPYGRFFFNTAHQKYSYSKPILDVGIQTALAEVNFNKQKFDNRYPDGVV